MPSGASDTGGEVMIVTRTIQPGEALRDRGMERAARHRQWRIAAGQLALLRAIRRNPERTATTDDATSDVSMQYADGGRWRGSVPQRLALDGLIERVGTVKSTRPSRHCGYVAVWGGRDDGAIDCRIVELERWQAANPPAEHTPEGNDGTLFDLDKNATPGTEMPSAPGKNERHEPDAE